MRETRSMAAIGATLILIGLGGTSDGWANAATRFLYVAPYAARVVEVEVIEATDSVVRCVVTMSMVGGRIDSILVMRRDDLFPGTARRADVSHRYLVALDTALVLVRRDAFACGTINAIEVTDGSVDRRTYDGRNGRRTLAQVGRDIERARREWSSRIAKRRERQ